MTLDELADFLRQSPKLRSYGLPISFYGRGGCLESVDEEIQERIAVGIPLNNPDIKRIEFVIKHRDQLRTRETPKPRLRVF